MHPHMCWYVKSLYRPTHLCDCLLSMIPDWGHLLYSEEEFIRILETSAFKHCAGLSQHVAEYVYR